MDSFDPPCEFRFGATTVLPWLWLGGEEDVDEPLEAVDVWIDFRNDTPWNRKIKVPDNVFVIRLPFEDGNAAKAEQVIPFAKRLTDDFRAQGKKILVSCHAGVSRSALLALWCLAEEEGGLDTAWCKLKLARPHIEPHEAFGGLMKMVREETSGMEE